VAEYYEFWVERYIIYSKVEDAFQKKPYKRPNASGHIEHLKIDISLVHDVLLLL
jgi:hypothetical protein